MGRRVVRHRNSQGISLVEVLLASTLFGFLVVIVVSAIVFSYRSVMSGGEYDRAHFLAEEAVEAVRNIRDKSYVDVAVGTHGITQAGGVWSLTGSSDSSGVYKREVTISDKGANRKIVDVKVSWGSGFQERTVKLSTQLSNWRASTVKSWAAPITLSAHDSDGATDAAKVAVSGSYAYLVRPSASPNLIVYNITDPERPTPVGSLTLSGVPADISVGNGYAYITNSLDTAELQIVSVLNPAAPALVSTFDAAGNANGVGVFVKDSLVYVSRNANGGNDELVLINVANPSAPVRSTGYSLLNISMNDIYVNEGTMYVTTNSSSQEVIKVTNIAGVLAHTSIDLPGTAAATAIAGTGSTLFVAQQNILRLVDGGTLPSVLASTTLGSTINDVAYNSTARLVFAGVAATDELQILKYTAPSTLVVDRSMDIPGSASSLNGVAYGSALDVVVGASGADVSEIILFGPN